MEDMTILRTMPQVMQLTTKTIEDVTKIILELAERHRDNVLVQELVKHGRLGGDIDCEICRGFAVQDYDIKLTQHGIPHAIAYDNITGTANIFTRNIDREKVLRAKNELFVEQKRLSRLTPEEFSRLNSGKNIEIIRGRSNTEAKLFQQAAKMYGLSNLSFQKNSLEPNKVDIYYVAKDREKALAVMRKAILSSSGHTGRMATERIAKEIEFQNGVLKDVQYPENNFYVVSQVNPKEYIHFDKEGFQYFKNGSLVRNESRSSNKFAVTAKTYLSGMITPVRLNQKEFEVSEQERVKNVKNVSTYRTRLDLHKLAVEQEAKQMIDLKLTREQGGAVEIPKEFYSPNASFEKLFSDKTSLGDNERELIVRLDAMSSLDKAFAKNYIGRELANRELFLNACRNEKEDFYIVAKKNPNEFVHIDQNGLQYFRNGLMINTISRDAPNFENQALEITRVVNHSVPLSKDEFELPSKERNDLMRSQRSPLEAQTDRIGELERAARRLVETKLSLDNGTQVQIPSSFYNNNVSFSEFFTIEQVNDNETKEIINEFDKLEDKEKILVKNYIKDSFDKVEHIEVQTAYIDPAINENSLDTDIDRINALRMEAEELPLEDAYSADYYAIGDDD